MPNPVLLEKAAGVWLDSFYSEWFTEWMETYKGNEVKEGTLIAYRNVYDAYIKRHKLAQRPINAMRTEDIQGFYNDLHKRNISKSTISLTSAVLSNSLKKAERLGYIEKNPCTLATIPKKAKEAKHHRALTKSEQEIFMKYAEESYLYNAFVVLLNTGMRRGELIALKRSDISMKNKILHVRHTMKFDSGRTFEDTPKTKTSRRDIPLTPKAYEAIERQRKKYGESENGYIFTMLNGDILAHNTLQGEINRIIEKAKAAGEKIEHFTCHDLRDTFATRCIEAGMTPNTLKNILGHAKLSMTMDLYAQVLPDEKREALEAVAYAL